MWCGIPPRSESPRKKALIARRVLQRLRRGLLLPNRIAYVAALPAPFGALAYWDHDVRIRRAFPHDQVARVYGLPALPLPVKNPSPVVHEPGMRWGWWGFICGNGPIVFNDRQKVDHQVIIR
jgi:hypothetical protein